MSCLNYYMFSISVVPWYHWKYFMIIFLQYLRWGFSILNARAYLGKDLQDLAELYIYKNYYIDVFHFDDYLNKQFMGSSENQFLMPHAKSMVIFLFLLKGSFAVLVTVAVSYSRRMNSADLTSFTRPDLSDNFLSNNELTSWQVNLRAIIELEILFRKRNYRLEYGRTLNTNWVSKQILRYLRR